MIFKIASYALFLNPFLGAGLIVSILLFWFWKKKLPSLKSLRKIIIIFIVIIVVQALLMSFLNYYAWKNDALSQKLLPPDTPISYFLHYSWLHYFLNPILSILVAIVVFYGIQLLNRKFDNVLFYDEEPYLAALGILITNWPNCLIYLCLVLSLGLISHLILYLFYLIRGGNNSLRKVSRRPNGHGSSERSERENEAERQAVISSPGKSTASFRVNYFRLSLLYFWLPCALLVLFLGGIISKYFMV